MQSPGTSPLDHFHWACSLTFSQLCPSALNPCLSWVTSTRASMGSRLAPLRLEDLRSLVSELASWQEEWAVQRPPHVVSVYRQGTNALQFQLVPLAWLLEAFNFPGRLELLYELSWGFQMLGPLPAGSG